MLPMHDSEDREVWNYAGIVLRTLLYTANKALLILAAFIIR